MSSPMQLRPSEWKQNVLLNLANIQNYVLGIPDMTESGAGGIQPEHIAVIEHEIERARLFMTAWQRSRFEVPQVVGSSVQNVQNGASAPQVRKGGWPKGKPRARTRKASPPAEPAQ